MKKMLAKLHQKHPLLCEIVRFCLVGGVATLVDFLTMAFVQWLFQPSLYPTLFSLFTVRAEGVAYICGTGTGFLAGLIVNYFLSVLFVFTEKGNSRTVQGFLLFVALSAVGFFIHTFGMFIGYDVLHIPAWVVKIGLTLVVLVWNYFSRKFFIFRRQEEKS